MKDLSVIHSNAKEFKNKLSILTYPLAIKMIKNKKEIPKDAIRPFRDLGYHLDNCQAFALSRWRKKTIAMTKEDMWCMTPFIGYGFVKPSKTWLEGKQRNILGLHPEVLKKSIQSVPHFEVGKYTGIISAPLESCSFIPDMFLVYVDPYRLTHILVAKDLIDGTHVECILSGHAACIWAVVSVLKEKKCWISSPCRGDRGYAMTQNDELIFSAPIEMLSDFINIFRYLEDNNQFPFEIELHPDRKLKDGYADIGRTMGIPYDRVTN